MNRKVLFQVTAPAVAIGTILLGTCLASAWYINRLQTNLAGILSQNVTSLEAAQELEIRLRQLRFHCFLYLTAPSPERLEPIEADHRHFEAALETARRLASTPEERDCVRGIDDGYHRYRAEFTRLREEVDRNGPVKDLGSLADAHPVRHIVAPCQQLLRINKEAMDQTALESERVAGRAHLAMLLGGLLGPLGGLLIGYGVARGLSRSIYQLSVRVRDMARHFEQDVASVSVAADGDLQGLDRQLQQVVRRVEAVAERMRQLDREMVRAEQLSVAGQLAAGVAHEVRNPLTSVKMLVEAALRPRNCKPLSREDLEVIHNEVARVEQTVQGFLDFARPPRPRRQACDLRDVLAQAADLVRARAHQQGVEIDLGTPAGPVSSFIDRGQLTTVVVNLFLNAFDAMPQGGRLEIDLEDGGDEGIRLAVSDTGTGIAPEVAGRLFTPFASTKPTGTGLGLSISRRIIEDHGGRIIATNRLQRGACFTILLPGAGPSASHPEPEEECHRVSQADLASR